MSNRTYYISPALVVLVTAFLTFSAPAADLVPWPQSLTLQATPFAIDGSTRVVAEDASLAPLAAIVADEIYMLTGHQPATLTGTAGAGDIALRLDGGLSDEQYAIAVGNPAVVSGASYAATAMGTVTLLQAITGGTGAWEIPGMSVADEPALAWRSLSIDVARQWHEIDVLEQCIEMCRWYKIRYIQLHLCDDQSFTFPSTTYPNLATPGRSYTLQELEDLNTFATQRGVTLVPELEMPGHSREMRYREPTVFGETSYGCLNMGDEDIYDALDTLIGEMLDVFEDSPYFHIGGDETWLGDIDKSPDTAPALTRWNLNGNTDLYLYFVHQMHLRVQARGKQTIVWEGFHGGGDYGTTGHRRSLPRDIIVMAWESRYNPAPNLISEGFTIINAAWRPLYVVGNRRWPASHIYQDWNPWLIMHDQDSTYIQLDPSDPMLGNQMCSWEMKDELEIPYVRSRIAAMGDRVWNPDAGLSWSNYSARAASTDAKLEDIILPVTVSADGLMREDDNLFQSTLTVTLSADRPGTIRYTTNDTEPTASSAAYTPGSPFTLSASATVRARLYTAGGQPLGYAERQEYVKMATPKLFYQLWDTGPDHPAGLPDFDSLGTPDRDSVADTFTAAHYDAPAPGFAMRMSGWLNITSEDDYSITLMSADGPSQLWINGQLLIDRDVPVGLSTDGIEAHLGLAHLTPGLHHVEVRYIWDLFRRRLNINYQTPGMGSSQPLANLLAPLSSVPYALPTSIDFGSRDVLTGPSPARAVTLANVDLMDDLTITSVALGGADAGQFILGADSGETGLPPGTMRTIEVRFRPANTGPKSAVLTITSPDLPGGSLDVDLSGDGTTPGEVVLTPTSLSFGSQDIASGPTATQSITLSNASAVGTVIFSEVGLTGTHALQFNIASDSGETSLPPGATRTLQIAMDPAYPGAREAFLTVTSNDPDDPAVHAALTGTGTGSLPAPVLKAHFAFEDSQTYHQAPMAEETGNINTAWFENGWSPRQTWTHSATYDYAIYGHGNWSRCYLGADGHTHISPLTSDFTLTVWFRTSTANDVPIFSGDSWELRYREGELTLLMKDADNVPYTLSAAESGLTPNTWNHIAVTFQDVGHGNYEARYTINGERKGPVISGNGKGSGDGGERSWQIGRMYAFTMDELRIYDGILDQDTIRSLAVEDPANPGELEVTGGPLDFGIREIADGPTASQAVTLSNTHGSRNLRLYDVYLAGADAGEFGIASDTGQTTLGPGASRTVQLHFDPSAIDNKQAELVVLSNDADEDTVRLMLTGRGTDGVLTALGDIEATPPGPMSFGERDVTAGPSPAQPIVLANVDPSDSLAILGIQLAGAGAGHFRITGDTGEFLLDPGSHRTVQVAFDPSVSGSFAAELQVSSTDPDESLLQIMLTGTGTNAPSGEIDVTPAGPIAFGSMDVEDGASALHAVTIANVSVDAALAVSGVSIAGPDAGDFGIAVDSGETSLPPGMTRTLQLFFNPATAGAKTANLEIASDDIDEPLVQVALNGQGTSAAPEAELTVHLEMEETSGSHLDPITESTGNILTAQIDNTVYVQQSWDHSGTYGYAAYFPGGWGRYKLMADGDTVVSPITSNFSLAIWVKAELNGDPWHVFASNNNGGVYNGYALQVWSDGSVAFNTGTGGSSYAYALPAGTLSADTWYHLALTFRDAGGGHYEARFYINGAPTGGVLTGTAKPGTGGSGWNLGASAGGMFAGRGTMDDFRLYQGILSFSEVAELALEDPNADRNADGLPDAWQIKHFGDHTLPLAGPDQHGDADLTPNSGEYLAGTDPTDALSYPYVDIVNDTTGPAILVPTRRAEGDGYAGLTRTYNLQAVADPATDTTWPTLPGFSGVPASDLTIEYQPGAADSDRCYRVSIELN